MTNYGDEILMRRVDGELPPEVARRLDAAAAADPDLAARLEAMSALRSAARAAFALNPDPRDQELIRLIRTPRAPRMAPWRLAAKLLREAMPEKGAPLWIGLVTAAFVGGILVGPLLNTGRAGLALGRDGDIADPQLVRVLERRLAADGPDAGGRAVGLTFRNAEGHWCRTFEAGEVGLAGLACRSGKEWSLRALAPLAAPPGEVRTASAETPMVILAVVDASVSGETLDADAEARARDAGWR